MVNLTSISISRDDETRDDDGPWDEEAGNGGGAEEQEALQLSGIEDEGSGGVPAGNAEFQTTFDFQIM